MKRTVHWPPVVSVLSLAAVCSASAAEHGLKRLQYRQIHLGVQVRMVVYAPDTEVAERACRAAFRRIAELEDILSDYRARSELMRLSAKAGGPPVPVGDDLFTVLAHAHTLSQQTNGAFDATAGPYVRLWRTARRTGRLPADEDWHLAAELVGRQKMRLDPEARTVELLVPGMQLDVGGIAKGYVLDKALETLREHGVASALIQAGGEIVAGDPPPDRSGWRVRIAYGEAGRRYVRLANAAISSSGDTEQFVEIDGQHYSHIVDPRAGLRFGEPIVVTVMGPEGMTCDALATAACVLGEEAAAELFALYPAYRVYFHRPVIPEQSVNPNDPRP